MHYRSPFTLNAIKIRIILMRNYMYTRDCDIYCECAHGCVTSLPAPLAIKESARNRHDVRLTDPGWSCEKSADFDHWPVNWCISYNHSLESHAITEMAPVKLHFVVIYRPPGQLGTFLEELDGLFSSFSKDGSPLIVFGDFDIHLDRPYVANFHSLLASFDLKRLTTTSTHKSGSQLDLIYTRNCVADNILVKPLHTSDHYFITFNLHLATF